MRDGQGAEQVQGGSADGQFTVGWFNEYIAADPEGDVAVGADIGRVIRRPVDPAQVYWLKDDQRRQSASKTD
jgi:hypothetical protein